MGDAASMASEMKENELIVLSTAESLESGVLDWKEENKKDEGGKEGSTEEVFCYDDSFFCKLEKIKELWVYELLVLRSLFFMIFFTYRIKNYVTSPGRTPSPVVCTSS